MIDVHRPRRDGATTASVLLALAAACALVTATLFVWPARGTVRPIEPAAERPTASPVSTTPSVFAPTIVAGNIFSASRRAPRVIFLPPGAEPSPANGSMAASPAPGDEGTPSGMEQGGVGDGPRLFGIVSLNGIGRALLLLPGADSVPRLLAVGDRHAGYRVMSISTDRVVLASPTGSRTLRLISRTPPDSLENQP